MAVQTVLFVASQWFDNNGNPLAGGKLFSFAAGTSTPLGTFTDSTGGTPNPNPVVLDAAGRADVWLTAGTAYKLVMQNAAGVQQWSKDGINTASSIPTVGNTNIAGSLTLSQPTAATAGGNQSSFAESIQGSYWNGAAAAIDQWTLQDVLGAGTNPTSTLTIAHSGSSGAATIQLPAGLDLTFIRSRTASQAAAGFARLANGDVVSWRNTANAADVSLSDAGAAAAGTGNLADNLKWNGGGAQFAAYVDQSAAPANSGVVRVGNNVPAVVSRNAAGSGDVNAVLVDATNITNLGGAAGVSVAGQSTLAGIVTASNIAQTAAVAFTIKDNGGGTRYSIPSGGVTQSQINNTNLTGGNSNSVVLLNAQGNTGSINGTGAAVTLYTYTLPANTVANLTAIRITASGFHDTGTLNPSITINVNGVNVNSGSIGTVATQSFSFETVLTRTGTTTGEAWGIATSNAAIVPFSPSPTGLAWTSNQVITVQFNVTAGDHCTGRMFVVTQVQ